MLSLKVRFAAVAASLMGGLSGVMMGAAPASAQGGAFSCDTPTDFAVPGGNQLVAIDEGTMAATPLGGQSPVYYNAVGFDPNDHYLYAIQSPTSSAGNVLVRIDSAGTAQIMGPVAGLPTPGSGYAYSAGAFDPSGNLLVYSNDPSATTAYRIDPETKAVTGQIELSGSVDATDWAFEQGYLWSLSGNELTRVDPATGIATSQALPAAPAIPADTYNAAFTLTGGALAFIAASSNQEVQISLDSSLDVHSVSVAPVSGTLVHAATNDGASCEPAVGITFAGGAATVGSSYSAQLDAVGGTASYTWAVATGSSLPPGLTLDWASGVISGTPTSDGTFTFTVQVRDSSNPPQTSTRNVSIRVFPGPFSCATPTDFVAPDSGSGTQLIAIPEGSAPAASRIGPISSAGYNALAFNPVDRYLYAITITGSQGGGHLVRIDSGGNLHDLGPIDQLPAPQSSYEYASGAFDGNGTFWVVSNGDNQYAYGIDVATQQVTSSVRLDQQFDPIDWTYDYGYLWGLSDGFLYQVDPHTGHVATTSISGVPDGAYNADWTFADSTLGFVPIDDSANLVYRVAVTGGPLSPSSVMSTSSYTVSGNAHIYGTENDGAACGPALQLSAQTPDGTYGTPYTGSVQASGGTAPYSWTIASGSLPPGLALDPASGNITGTPTAAGSYPFIAQARDNSTVPQTVQEALTITMAPAPLTITASSGSMTYGTTPPPVTASYAGLVGGDTRDTAFSTPPVCSTTATASSDVGTYPTTCGGAAAANYSITYAPGTITVTPAAQTITFTTNAPSPAAVGGTYTPSATGGGSGNPVTFNIDGASTSGACSIINGTVSLTAAGLCIIDANQTGNTDYHGAAQVQQAFNIGYVTSGFLPPVSNAPTVNTGKAGKTYPLKWQLQQANGQYVTSLSAIQSVVVSPQSCSAFSTDPTSSDTATATGGTSLRYDSTNNQYVYNWQTSSTGCYSIAVTLTGGQRLIAFFKLS